MDLALNNLQRLICHKTQTTKQQPTKEVDLKWTLEREQTIDFNE